MKFLWPEMLAGLLAAPLLLWLYWWVLSRRKKVAMPFANLALVREAMGAQSSWRRHLPPALFFLGLLALLISLGRPAAGDITFAARNRDYGDGCLWQHARQGR
jgi:Ca-activated chloride channel homolog